MLKFFCLGEVSERFKVTTSKVVVGVTLPWVRIPPSLIFILVYLLSKKIFICFIKYMNILIRQKIAFNGIYEPMRTKEEKDRDYISVDNQIRKNTLDNKMMEQRISYLED